MQRAVWSVILAGFLTLSITVGSFPKAEASPGGEAVTLDITFGTLSFELPANYRVANLQNGTAEGPPVTETLIKNDGTRETYVGIPDQFTFFAYSHYPGGDNPDLRALIQEKDPSLSQESIFQERDIIIPGDAGTTYSGYYILAFTTQGQYVASTRGYLVVLLEAGWVASLDVSYFVDQQDTTSEQGTFTYTVNGAPLIPKHKADVATMIASVKVSWQSPESSSTPTIPAEISPPEEQTLPTIPTDISPPEEQPLAENSQAQSEVFVKEPGSNNWKPVSPAEEIISVGEGYAVRTDQGTVRLKDLPNQGDQVFVGQNTELQIEEQGTVLDLLLGKIRVLLEKLGPHESEFEVNTPIVITGVRDTEFIVDTTKERTDVLVLEGTVELSDLGRNKTVLVKAGESSMVEAGSLPSEPQKFDSATVFQKYESLFESEEEMKAAAGGIEKPAKGGETAGFPVYLLAIPVIVIAVVIILVMRRRRRT